MGSFAVTTLKKLGVPQRQHLRNWEFHRDSTQQNESFTATTLHKNGVPPRQHFRNWEFHLLVFCVFFYYHIFLLGSSLLCSRNSDPGSHGRLIFPLLPITASALRFYREKTSTLCACLADSCRIGPTHARRSQLFFFIFAIKFRISPRWDSNSRANTINGSIRGLLLL